MKEDASSPTVSSKTVMLTFIIDANNNGDVDIVDIPNKFVLTAVEDEKDRACIRICETLLDILTSITTDVYGPYVMVRKKGKKQ